MSDPVADAAPAPPTAVPTLIPFPQKLDMDGNVATNLRKFKRTWNNYEKASGLVSKPSDLRTATLLTCVGSEAMDVFDGFAFDNEEDKEDIEKVIEKFESFCVGKTNLTYERYIFHTCTQGESESFDSYLTKVRKLSKTCNYGALEHELITDRLVLGIRDNGLRKRLLQEDKLTIDKCIDMCRAAEASSTKVKSITKGASAPEEEDVQVVKPKRRHPTNKHVQQKSQCKYCGKSCEPGRCPAFGKKCRQCGKHNHFASECRSRKPKSKQKNTTQTPKKQQQNSPKNLLE